MGLIAENFSRSNPGAAFAMIAQQVQAGMIYAYQGEVITNLHCQMTAPATPANVTHAQGWLLAADSNTNEPILAATADDTGGATGFYATAGEKPVSIAGGAYTVTKDGPLYVAWAFDGTSMPSLTCGVAVPGSFNALAGGVAEAWLAATVTIPKAVAATITKAGSTRAIWVAVS